MTTNFTFLLHNKQCLFTKTYFWCDYLWNMKNDTRAYFLASFVVLFWGTSATAFKIGLQYMSPAHLLFWSSLFASTILFIVLAFQKKLKLLKFKNGKEFGLSVAEATLNPFLYYLVLFEAYNLLPAQVAQPLNYIWPIVLVILAALFFKHSLHYTDIIALIASLIGVAFISSQGNINIFAKSNPVGVLLAISSSIVWASFWIINMYDKNRDEEVKLCISFAFATIFMLLYIILSSKNITFNLKGISAALYIGAFEMGVTFLLWLKALNSTSNTARLGNFSYLVPFVSLVFVSLILHEKIVWTTFIGLLIIIGAIIFQRISKKN
jgi:drug/metabolite transporter (DMT)-like permease